MKHLSEKQIVQDMQKHGKAAKNPSLKRNVSNVSESSSCSASNRASGAGSPLRAAKARGSGGNSSPVDEKIKDKRSTPTDPGNLSPRSECLAFSKKIIQEMHVSVVDGTLAGVEPVSINKGILKIQTHSVECELVQHSCGRIDVAADGSEVAPVYLHALRMTL